MPRLSLEYVPPETLRPYARNARRHTDSQITRISENVNTSGFNNPILVDEEGVILAGHARQEAAKKLGLTYVPVVRDMPPLTGSSC
jgi:ParB-like chromosome segregation protein Spo0J